MRAGLRPASLAVCLILCTVSGATGQAARAPADAGTLAGILRKISAGEALDGKDISTLDGTAIRVEEPITESFDPEVSPPETRRNVYILKVESRDANLRQLQEIQRALLLSQLTAMRALAAMARRQDTLERRAGRTENVQREMLLGIRDVVRGIDIARCDLASTNTEKKDIAEEIQECLRVLKKIHR